MFETKYYRHSYNLKKFDRGTTTELNKTADVYKSGIFPQFIPNK